MGTLSSILSPSGVLALAGNQTVTGEKTFNNRVNFAQGSFVNSNGDFFARRANGATAVYYFVDGSKYLYFDGTNYVLVGGRFVAHGGHMSLINGLADGNINLALGNYFTHAGVGGNITFAFNNPPPAGYAFAFTLRVTHNSGTITWPASVRWSNGAAPTLTVARTHLFTFVTDDGGTTWRGAAQTNYT